MKDVIAKLFIIITACLLIFSTIMFPILSVAFGYQYEAVEKQWIFLLILTVVSGIAMCILMVLFPPKASKRKIDITKLGYNDFSSFYYHLKEKAKKLGFQMQEDRVIEDIEFFFFTRNYRLWEKDCIAVIKTSSLSDMQMIIIEDVLADILSKQSDTINGISIICVERITPTFKRYINIPAVQGIKNGRFIAGISFGKKNCYLSNIDKKIGFYRYKRLRQLFLSLIRQEDMEKGGQGDGSAVS